MRILRQQGPGDIFPYVAWWGLRAYSAASAAAQVAAVDVFDVTGSQTFTLKVKTNGDLDTSVLNGAHTFHVSKLYDQTGRGNDLTNATDNQRPVFTLNGLGTKPIMTGVANGGLFGASSIALSQPFSISAVANNINSGAAGGILGDNTNVRTFFGGAGANTIDYFAGSTVGGSSNDNNWYALGFSFGGGLSRITVNGTSLGNFSPGSNSWASTPNLFTDSLFTHYFTGNMVEAGLAAGNQNSNFSTLSSNQRSYWVF